MLTFLYCTFEGPQTEEFWGHITLNVAYCVWHGNYWLKYWWKPNENIKDKGWGHVGWSEYQLQTVLYVCFCVCVCAHPHVRLHMTVYFGAGGKWRRFSSPLTCGCLRPPWTEETWPPSSPLPPLRSRCYCSRPDKPPHRTSGPSMSSYLEDESNKEFLGFLDFKLTAKKRKKKNQDK